MNTFPSIGTMKVALYFTKDILKAQKSKKKSQIYWQHLFCSQRGELLTLRDYQVKGIAQSSSYLGDSVRESLQSIFYHSDQVLCTESSFYFQGTLFVCVKAQYLIKMLMPQLF